MEKVSHSFEHYLFACPIKAGFGVDCPGCGFQRSFLALIRGDISTSWEFYPALIPFLLTLGLLILAVKTKFKFRYHVLAASLLTTCSIISFHYLDKFI